MRILVVEDDPDGQELVARILAYHAVQNDVVQTGEDAVSALAGADDYSVVITDLALPGLDGWGVLNSVLTNPHTAHIPCVAMTAYHSVEVAQEALRRGFRAYFPKPIDAASFYADLERVLSE